MAWLDDRVWCHPKLVGLSDRAFRAWVNSIAYAAGMGTGGVLTAPQQKLVGAPPRVRKELISASLWDQNDDGSVSVHDWEEHNEKRDARRKADRERKRLERAAQRQASLDLSSGPSAGQSTGQGYGQSTGSSTGASAGPAHVETVETVEGSDETLVRVQTDVSPTSDRSGDTRTGDGIENGELPEIPPEAKALLEQLQATAAVKGIEG